MDQMQQPVKKFERRHKVVTAVVVSIGVVLVWRGMWGLLDLFLFPMSPILSYAASILIGLGILSVTGYLLKQLLPE